MKLPSYSEHAIHWGIDPEMVFINHGSFGATPLEILKKQNDIRTRMESEPVRFMSRELQTHWYENRDALADFVGSDHNDLVFVKNATMGVNTVLHSLQFQEGDELLTTNHVYGACLNTLKFYCERYKCKLVIAEVPYPIEDPGIVTEAVLKAVTSKTKFVLIDHITSATGIIFPVTEIVKALENKGIEVMIDGAHAPGMIPLNVAEIGASYYTGNCHKWLCSPKGSALLHVRKDKQAKIFPLQLSHYNDKPMSEEMRWSGQFIWPGTDDYSAWFCVKDSIAFMGSLLPGGWPELRQRNHQLTLEAREMIAARLGSYVPAPAEMIGHLANIYIQECALPPYGFKYIMPEQERLFKEFNIEVPIIVFNGSKPRMWVRIAVQAYNSMEQYEYLADALQEIMR